MTYPELVQAVEIRAIAQNGESVIKALKNQLNPDIEGSILHKANAVTAEDLKRVGASTEQGAYLTTLRDKLRAAWTAIKDF